MRPDEDQLIAAWHAEDPVATLAQRFGMDEKQVLNAWRALKRTGRLPMGDRPKRGRDSIDAGIDGRPKVTGLWRSDPLLEKLQRGER